jgi:F-type H+-transporting ATPase subunit epsilon
MLTALDSGVLRLRIGSTWQAIAVSGGFAEVDSNDVTVLVNAAELGRSIDAAAAEKEYQAAQQAFASFEGQPPSTEKVKAEQALAQARARLQASRAG